MARPGLVGALAVVDRLAGGVVDGRDVVGVERVPAAQGVGGDAQPNAEELVVGGQRPGTAGRAASRDTSSTGIIGN